jgi:hypothetical protein
MSRRLAVRLCADEPPLVPPGVAGEHQHTVSAA